MHYPAPRDQGKKKKGTFRGSKAALRLRIGVVQRQVAIERLLGWRLTVAVGTARPNHGGPSVAKVLGRSRSPHQFVESLALVGVVADLLDGLKCRERLQPILRLCPEVAGASNSRT